MCIWVKWDKRTYTQIWYRNTRLSLTQNVYICAKWFSKSDHEKNTFLQFRRVHKTSSCNLFAFEATLKESPVRIFLHKEENEKKSKFYCCHCSNRLVISFFPVMLPCLIYVCKEAFSISRIGKLEHIRNIFVQ